LLAALGIFLLGREGPSDDLGVAVADLEAAIRENAAAAQARADTLAQLPRLGWAVATDESTMRDLTGEELAFRPHPGEQIEITQMRKGGGEARRLLHLPAESETALPVLPGTQVVVRQDKLHVVTVVSVEPRQRADELVGVLAVSKQIDTAAIGQRLAARGINAVLRTTQGALTLAGNAPASPEAKIALTGPAAEGVVLVAANVGKVRWPRVVAPLVLVVSLAAAGVLWRRGLAAPRPTSSPLAPVPTEARGPTPGGRSTAPTPQAVPTAAEEWASPQAQVTPAVVNPLDVQGAAPEAEWEPAMSGRVEISLARSGSLSMSPPHRIPGEPPPGAPKAAASETDPRAEEYRELFSEFVKLRRTTGESVEGLDADHFVQMLRDKRAQIMSDLPVKDVRFKLAFQNGKAGIRYLTVT
jgi:hypothetical protein